MCLCSFLHLLQDHGRDLFRMKSLPLALVRHLYLGLVVLAFHYLERPQLHIILYSRILELATDQPLCIIYCILWISGSLTLRCVTN
mmetsp:Transcript_13206/g.35758  ORF Transcript_13206/g.35758 Transcript_13206/m.35758 type:complete len:86 (+) Transcript_13206:1015-1272(+)